MKISEKTDGQLFAEVCGRDWSTLDAFSRDWWELQAGDWIGAVAEIRRQAEELEQAGKALREMRAWVAQSSSKWLNGRTDGHTICTTPQCNAYLAAGDTVEKYGHAPTCPLREIPVLPCEEAE